MRAVMSCSFLLSHRWQQRLDDLGRLDAVGHVRLARDPDMTIIIKITIVKALINMDIMI